MLSTALLAGALAAGGCASQAPRTATGEVVRDHHGRLGGYVESRRVTDFCPDAGKRPPDARCVVTRGWDYDRGVSVVRTYDPDGRLLATEEPDGADLSLVPEEAERVEALVRADPRTGPVVNRPGVMIWAGGFVMREPGDPHCDRGSRCIRAIAATDGGNNVVLHSVVDLMADAVVYPSYAPAGPAKAHHQEH